MTAIRKFSKKHALAFFILYMLLGMIVNKLVNVIFSIDRLSFTNIQAITKYIVPGIFLGVTIYVVGTGKQIGFRKKGFLKGLLLGAPLIVAGIVLFLLASSVTQYDASLIKSPAIIYYTLGMLCVGLYEEIYSRGLLLNVLINKEGKSKKGLMKSAIMSSAIFGLGHFPNMIAKPELFVSIIIQMIYASLIGLFFAAVYIRCRNIWPVIIIHAVFDWLTLLPSFFSSSSTATFLTGSPTDAAVSALFTLAFAIPLGIVGFVLLRKIKVKEEICHENI